MTIARTSYQYLGEVKVLVEYEYDAGEPEGRAGSSWDGPGAPASVSIIAANIIGESGCGCMVDADAFSPATLAQWAEAILQEHAE